MKDPASHQRLVRKLRDVLGEELSQALDDPQVVEIMLNPDGRLFVERLGLPIRPCGHLARNHAEVLIGIVAHVLDQEINGAKPIISGELPIGGHRFEGLLPPVVSAPTFSIRRRALRQIALETYVSSGAMTSCQHDQIADAIRSRKNIVVSGGTGSGKTTLANALILEISRLFPHDRILLIEDTAEIECAAENCVMLRGTDHISMDRLLKSTLRLRPDRIIVGEVRDGAALTLLKAWNTGHPGGLTTLHANHGAAALQRLEQLVSETSQQSMQSMIASAIDLVISVRRTPDGRRVEEVLHVEDFADGRYHISRTPERTHR